MFNSLYSLYDKLEKKLSEASEDLLNGTSVLEISNNATLLLNNKAKNDITKNMSVLEERLTILRKLGELEYVTIEELEKLLIEDDINSNIVINDIPAGSSNGYSDERKNIQADLKKVVGQTVFSESEFEIPSLEYAALPSVVKKIELETIERLLDIDTSGFMDTFSSFAGFFSYWNDISCDKIYTDIKNKILIDEYILSYMTNRLDGLSKKSMVNEVEYILGGNALAKDNNKLVEQKLLAFRFVFDFADIMNDDEKCASAEFIARAVAFAISSGAGVTLYKYIIITCWALMQAYMDIENLLKGESVPIISIGSEDSTLTKSQNYDFYLRLLLLFMDEETKLLRISDVIQINMKELTGEEYRLSGLYNKLTAKSVVKIEFIFPSLVGMEKVYKKEELYELSY